MTVTGAFAALDDTTISRLAAMLENGVLAPPYSVFALQQYVGRQAPALATCLSELDEKGLGPPHIALVLRAYAEGRQGGGSPTDWIDLVVSGPDAANSARDTAVAVRQLFGGMKDHVLVVGFAVHQGREVFRRLAERLDEDASLSARLCIEVGRSPTDTSVSSSIISRFAERFLEHEWPGKRVPRIYYDPRSLEPEGSKRSALHAKCVVVDGAAALVTSANLTEAAQQRNIELGLLVQSPQVATRIEEHFNSLIEKQFLLPLPVSRS